MIKCTCDFVIDIPESSKWEKHYNNCDIVLDNRKKNGEFPNGLPRSSEGFLLSQNKYLDAITNDYLYHLDMGVGTHDFPKLFGDVKFVCMGGTAKRMKEFAKFASAELGIPIPEGTDIVDLTITSNRYAMYKVGPILAVNHGIGIPTLSVVLQEVIKLLRYSKVKDPIMFRLGTSGGIVVEPGSCVVTETAFNGMLKTTYDLPILGKMVSMPAILDKRLAQEVSSLSEKDDDFKIYLGNTMGADDFYNGQGRTDGPFCEYSEEDKFDFLNKLKAKGIKNIEMEVTCFSALTHKAGIKAVDICVTFLDRLKGDQVTIPKNSKTNWETRPMIVALRYIQAYLKKSGYYTDKKRFNQ